MLGKSEILQSLKAIIIIIIIGNNKTNTISKSNKTKTTRITKRE